MKLPVLYIFLILIIFACNTQKNVQKSAPETSELNTMYTTDYTDSEESSDLVPPKIHLVQKGESLWVIAKKYDVTIKDLAEANNIENTSLIKVNQKLIIPEMK